MVSGNSSAASWSAEATSSAILTFLKPNHFVKWSDHSTLALHSPVLDSSPYICFKLSYNDFAFSRIILESTDVTFLEQSWTHIRAAFSIRDKKIFLEKYKVLMPSVLARVTVSWGNFFFLQGGGGGGGVLLLDSSILEWWATIIADLNLQYILNNWTFSCHAMTFLCFLEELLASLGHHGVIQGYGIALNTMKNTHQSQEYSFYCNIQFPGEMSRSCGDD